MGKQNKGAVDRGEAKRIEQIKRLVIIALFSDDEFMDRFVLKGGNAIDLIYRVGTRASVDVDLSMSDAFRPEELDNVRSRIERNLASTFRPEGFEVFDVTMHERPEVVSAPLAGFWGGYSVSFKLIEAEKHAAFASDLSALQRNAVRIGAKGKFEIDISKYEYCEGKTPHDIEGFRIFAYTPAMLVCEKLRAICQQMPEYGPVVHRERPGGARARDFLDIYALVKRFSLDMTAPKNRRLLRYIFEAKKVPLELLDAIAQFREFHRPDFEAVKATVKAGVALRDFDFYFDYVVALQASLKAFGHV